MPPHAQALAQEVACFLGIELGGIKIKRFADGEIYVQILVSPPPAPPPRNFRRIAGCGRMKLWVGQRCRLMTSLHCASAQRTALAGKVGGAAGGTMHSDSRH